MTRFPRSILGLTIAIALVPVIVFALPGTFTSQVDEVAEFEDLHQVVEEAVAERDLSTLGVASQPPGFDILQSATTTTSTADSPLGSFSTTIIDEASTPTTLLTTASTTIQPSSTTLVAKKKPTITTTPAADHPPQVEGNITGDACPCTVTGTVELKGEINLQGDLMVTGGTLIARPGVNVNGNGFQIMFMNGGKADFQGTPVFTWSGNGSNANLERDINFRNLRRIIYTSKAGPSILKYFTVRDSGTATPGDFPLHWHLNGDSTRGTIVEGVVVINGANHAFWPHGSNGITFIKIQAHNTTSTAFWWDPPGSNDCGSCNNSHDIVVDGALVDGVHPPDGSRGNRISAFQLGAGSGNVMRDAIALNVSGGSGCAGFVWPEKNQGVWVFENAVAESPRIGSRDCHGIFVWQNNEDLHVVDGFSGDGIDHGAYNNRYLYRNFDVPYVNIHAGGWRMENGHIGELLAKRHRRNIPVRFDNVTIDVFTINNGINHGDVAGTYILNGSGLTCNDIIYAQVVPGTQVIIDGSDCPGP